MENYTAPSFMEFATNETLVKQVANFFNVRVANVTNQSVVQQETLFDLYEAYRTREKQQLITYQAVAYVVGTLIILSNIIVVISSGLILRRGQQRKSTYLLLGNVSLADTIIGGAIIFGAAIDNAMSSNPLCIFQIGMMVCPAMVSIFSVGLIAVDRYFYILHGLHYQRYFNTTRVRIAIVIIWIIGITLGFMPVTGWVNNELIYTRCYFVALFPVPLILLSAFLCLIPIILMTVLNFIILVRALRNVKDIKAAQKSVNFNLSSNKTPKLGLDRGNVNINRNFPAKPTRTSESCPSFNALCDNSYNTSFMKNLDKSQNIGDLYNDNYSNDDISDNNNSKNGNEVHKNTRFLSSSSKVKGYLNKSVFNKCCKEKTQPKPKEASKWRAITVVMLTTGSLLFTWLPFYVVVTCFVFCEEKLTNPKCIEYRTLLEGTITTLIFLNSILNPLIYAWWHKGFQKAVRTLFIKYWCINAPY